MRHVTADTSHVTDKPASKSRENCHEEQHVGSDSRIVLRQGGDLKRSGGPGSYHNEQ